LLTGEKLSSHATARRGTALEEEEEQRRSAAAGGERERGAHGKVSQGESVVAVGNGHFPLGALGKHDL